MDKRTLQIALLKMQGYSTAAFLLLYYEYDFNYHEFAAMEHCIASSVGKSITRAKEKIKAQMKKYLC